MVARDGIELEPLSGRERSEGASEGAWEPAANELSQVTTVIAEQEEQMVSMAT